MMGQTARLRPRGHIFGLGNRIIFFQIGIRHQFVAVSQNRQPFSGQPRLVGRTGDRHGGDGTKQQRLEKSPVFHFIFRFPHYFPRTLRIQRFWLACLPEYRTYPKFPSNLPPHLRYCLPAKPVLQRIQEPWPPTGLF